MNQCECYDRLCCAVEHVKTEENPRCSNKAVETLFRIDMIEIDNTGTRFCEACATDALASGVFTTS